MATVKDVARDAGVSVGTVSRVLNGMHVSEKNRIKVEESIRRLNYEMDYYARGLKVRNTRTMAVIIPDTLNPFFARWVYELEKVISEKKYKMLLCQTQGDEEKEGWYFKMAAQNKVDGIIGITYNHTDAYLSGNFPFVSLDRHFTTEVCCVASDNYRGGVLAAQRLLQDGCRRPVYIRSGSRTSGETLKRGAGFRDTFGAEGIGIEEIDLGCDQERPGDREKIKTLLRQRFLQQEGRKTPDGIFVSTDVLACIVCEALEACGLRVPQQVQVIGYDGVRRDYSENYCVSTIVQPMEEMARACVELLLRQIRGERVKNLTIFPVAFAEGGTTRKREI